MLWLVPLLVVVLQGMVVVSGPHLADVSILLPPKMTHPVEYRLQGIDGCFQWSWNDHDVLSVLPEYNSSNHCSTSARLRSITPYSGRKETTIYASDVPTGIVITCKVFIDNLSRINIFPTSVKLDLYETVVLRVRAFDKEDNVFTSLVGIQFMWEILTEADSNLVHVPLEYSPMRINLEDNGVCSDLYAVKGIGTGLEIVSVHLLEHHRKDLVDKIVLTVAEAISVHSLTSQRDLASVNTYLYPQNPDLRVGSDLNFTIIGLNDQFSGRWFSGNESILSVCESSGIATAVGLGTTQVLFESSSVKLQTTVRVVMEDIFVDAPKEMLTNVPFPKDGYKFSVKLRKYGGALGNYKGVPFDCKSEPRYVGYVVPWMDRNTGNFYCLFFPYSPELLMRLAPGLKDMMPIRSVSITASMTKANQVSGFASARFTGGFSIFERNGQETKMLRLSRDTNTTFIILVGNTDVQIHVNGWASIKVSPISREDFGLCGHVVYEVKALHLMSSRGQIVIELAANGQRMEIDVEIDVPYDHRAGEIPYIIIGLIFEVAVFCFLCYGSIVGKEQANIADERNPSEVIQER